MVDVTGSTGEGCGSDPAQCRTLDDDLGWALGAVARRHHKRATDVLADLPGGPRGYQVLVAAASTAAGTQLALAQQLGVDRTVMTYLLDDLERQSLVERRPDPADRRARRIVATERGMALVLHVQRQLADIEDEVLCALDPEERAMFRDLLHRVATHADGGGPAPCTAVSETAVASGTQSAGPPVPHG
jgi:DNA-binding MarR family transcriptional regulator